MHVPRLSVVVPVYGTKKYLPTCIDHLLRQTMRDAEFIFVDDASPDGAGRLLADYARQDARIRILTHDKNRGLFQARLTGAKAAAGDYIAFLDSDDYVSVDFYRAAVEKADQGFDVVMGDTVWVLENGRRITRPMHDHCLPRDELHGDEVRSAFFSQQLQCYSWHTIWNKVYSKALFDRCIPEFERLDRHIIMTEDIAFSCVLLHRAQSLARIRGGGVFYCEHKQSSTGSAWKNQRKFFKNYEDITAVFEFAADYLQRVSDAESLAHLMQARTWYARMWRKAREACASSGEAKARADALTARLAPDYHPESPADDREIWFFDSHTAPWNDWTERIRRAIAGLDGHDEEIVSFDVFDTLIQRPFREPSDLFHMLEDAWQKANRRCILSFAQARAEAESSARTWARGRKEDVDLYDIYNALRVTCGATEDCADDMRFAECEAEIRFCRPRKTGVALLKLAKAMGKRVILVSDMYLDGATIARMLEKCGVTGYEKLYLSNEANALKWNGGLYKKVLDDLGAAPEQILHIGDNWENDFLKPREMGMHSLHHPRAMDVMTDPARTALSILGQESAASLGGNASLQKALSFRCMQGLTAIRFFDDGYAPTDRASNFAANPALLGYYAVGGHVLALAKWLIQSAKRDGIKKLVFLARDGMLVKEAADALLTQEDGIATCYHPASRKCLIPALTAHPSGFYNLPINIPAYSVQKTVALLDFCTAELPEEEIRRRVEEAGFDWSGVYPGRYRYLEFIAWYLDHLYDGRRHQIAYNTLRDYYEPVLTEGAACFDMGYSGRLQAALSQLAGHGVPVYFVHDDEAEAPRLSRAYRFPMDCFYGLKPGMSGAFREFLLSSGEAPCIGFARRGGAVEPLYGRSEYNAAAKFLIRVIQQSAMDFVRDYRDTFANTPAEQVSAMALSMPYESVLRYLPSEDTAIFTGVCFEDTVFAGRDDIDLATLIRDQSAAACQDAAGGQRDLIGFIPEKTPFFKCVIGMLLFQPRALKDAVKRNLSDHPRRYAAVRALWRMVKPIKNAFRKGAK